MKRIPVIYDVDTGLDDSMALFVGVNDPRFNVLAITATYGNCRIEYAISNTLNATKLLNRTDIPVAAGAAHGWKMPKHPAPYIHGEKGSGTYVYPYQNKDNLVKMPAWDLIAEKCLESEEKVTIFVLGPCTNVANAIIK
ncbi:MAG: nucleoside hydrolase [Erysipelotrichaceae bacterium]|nr:nucleoside hydrolase [Erysipelotrichaceae bacterium]